jgi:hypothetical protein
MREKSKFPSFLYHFLSFSRRIIMLKLLPFMLLLLGTAWSQLTVKNTNGDVVMQVDGDANVTIGSTLYPGALTTHTITILDGASNGLVLKSNADGLASWDTDDVNDADHIIGNEYQDLNEVLSEGHNAGDQPAINFSNISIGTSDTDYLLNVYDDTSPHPSLVHFHENPGDVGGYLSSAFPSQFLISGGMALTNTSSTTEWTAKSDRATSVGSYEGNLYITNDIGLTAGNQFIPTRRMVVGGTGSLFIGDDLPVGWAGYQNAFPKANIIDENGSSQLRVGTSFTNDGAYLSSGFAHQFNISGGAEIIDSDWTARSSWASIIGSYQGEIHFFNDTGLANGSIFIPTERMRLKTNGDLHITGTLHEGSSRELKTDIFDLPLQAAHSALLKLNPVTFRYKQGDGDTHVGFIAEDVPELVSTADRKSMVSMDVVGVLTKVLQDQVQKNQTLLHRIAEMEKRLDAMEH